MLCDFAFLLFFIYYFILCASCLSWLCVIFVSELYDFVSVYSVYKNFRRRSVSCYERSTLLYNVVIFILLYFVVCNENLFAYYCFIRGICVVLTCAVSIYSFGIDLSCDLTCVRIVAQKTRSRRCHVMKNSNWLDRIGQCCVITIYRVLANFVDQQRVAFVERGKGACRLIVIKNVFLLPLVERSYRAKLSAQLNRRLVLCNI